MSTPARNSSQSPNSSTPSRREIDPRNLEMMYEAAKRQFQSQSCSFVTFCYRLCAKYGAREIYSLLCGGTRPLNDLVKLFEDENLMLIFDDEDASLEIPPRHAPAQSPNTTHSRPSVKFESDTVQSVVEDVKTETEPEPKEGAEQELGKSKLLYDVPDSEEEDFVSPPPKRVRKPGRYGGKVSKKLVLGNQAK